MKKLLSLLLAAALAVSLLVFPAEAAETVRFSDLADPVMLRTAETLRLMGVMDGYSDGTFRPHAQLSRAQFCKMAICAMDSEEEMDLYAATTIYPDVKPSYWASAYINLAAKGKGIIAGYTDGRFHPDRTVTLGQAATILLRVLGYQDKDIKGIWPKSYVAAASRTGLLDGISQRDGNAALTRADAAQMFLNLLQTGSTVQSGKEGEPSHTGGSFLSTLGLTVKENVVLVSSSALGPNGKNNAFQLASGEVYQLTDGKTSSGILDGSRGTLVLKNGKALTFLPSGEDSVGRAVTLAGASALQFTDTSGIKYTAENDTGVYYNGREQKWSEVYSWLTPGTALTVYLNDAGNAAYIIVGGGTAANTAVVVYKNGSTDGFDSLTNGTGGYTLYKNGSSATTRDLRAYDVAVYSSATNSVRVSDTKLTGYYETCRPSPTEAAYITVMGHEFPVLTTAQASLAVFKPGEQITLLLTEDNQVAGAVKPENASGNALGVVKSNSGGSAEVELLCGVTVKGSAGEIMANAGELVRVVSEEKGVLRLYRQTGNAAGELDLTNRKLGNTRLAESVTVLEYGSKGLAPADLSALPALTPASRVTYARTNWAGNVDLILLGGTSRDTVLYGRAEITYKSESVPSAGDGEHEDTPASGGTRRVAYVSVFNGKDRVGPYRLDNVRGGDTVINGSYVVGGSDRDGVFVRLLTRNAAVPNTAWTGKTAVTVSGRSCTVPADVACYNRDSRSWTTLDAAHAYADKADLYVEGGVVRVIEVGR